MCEMGMLMVPNSKPFLAGHPIAHFQGFDHIVFYTISFSWSMRIMASGVVWPGGKDK